MQAERDDFMNWYHVDCIIGSGAPFATRDASARLPAVLTDPARYGPGARSFMRSMARCR